MNQLSNAETKNIRKQFKQFNQLMLAMWKLGLGKHINAFPRWTGKIMVVTHMGRKSRRRYKTPVNYAILNGDVYCVSGFGEVADWFLNIKINPMVEVWLPEGWWAGTAKEVTDSTGRLPIIRQVLINSGLAAKAVDIDPITMSDPELKEATKDYRLVRIIRSEALTGSNGPGELAWIWPLFVMFLLPVVFILFVTNRSRH